MTAPPQDQEPTVLCSGCGERKPRPWFWGDHSRVYCAACAKLRKLTRPYR